MPDAGILVSPGPPGIPGPRVILSAAKDLGGLSRAQARRLARTALLFALAFGPATLAAPQAGPATAAAIDPFYSGLLADGMQSFEDQQFAEAAKSLRIACFGMLEHPVKLGACLARLGLAQAESGDRNAFNDTFRRLAVVEERFQGYRQAELPAALRAGYEKWLVRWIPELQLASVPAFAPLAERRIAAKLRRLPPKERRAGIDELLRDQPANPRWLVLKADLEIEEGRIDLGLASIDAALAADPANVEARCLKGFAASVKGDCAKAVEELAVCEAARQDASFAEALLSCQVKLGQWSGAAETLAALPEDLAEDRRFEKLARQVERNRGAPPPPAGSSSRTEAATPDPAPETQAPPPSQPPPEAPPSSTPPAREEPVPAAPPPRPALGEEESRKLVELRQRVARVQYSGELDEPFRQAVEIADAHPEAREAQFLAGEIAYRASRWQEAVSYFRRGGDPGEERPVLLFYLAVALYESGNREAAAATLTRGLPRLEKTPLVEGYREKILGTGKVDG